MPNPEADPTPTDAPSRSLWRALSEAIHGTEADYTQVALRRAIFLLAVPMILELLMESTFAVADIYFVGRLGASAVATVGITETFLFLLYSVAIGLATAVTAIVARRVGEKKREEAGSAGVQAVFIALLSSLPFAAAGILFAPDLLRLMGADAWAVAHGQGYTRWMLGGCTAIMLLFVLNAVFRGAGDAAIAMRVLWLANAINLVLDPLLIFGLGPIPALGIRGAAIATTIGRGTGVLYQLWRLAKGSPHLRVAAAQLAWRGRLVLDILRTARGGVGQMIIGMTSWIFLMRILTGVGSEAVAGATIALRIALFTMMPAWGLSNAAATLVGQNLGAGRPERAEAAVWKIGSYNMVFMVAVSVVYFLFNRDLVGLFSANPAVVSIGAEWLRILSYSYFVYGWWMVSVQAFNGAGDTATPTKINFVFFWLLQIPLSWYLAVPSGWEQSGVFWGVFFSETSVGLFTLWLFSRGGWKRARV
ncbi:MAG: MATE family efflux transporter [Thermoanaerobaculia bacterium]